MMVSSVILTLAGWWITARVIEPRQAPGATATDANTTTTDSGAAQAPRALRAAGVAFAVTATLLLAGVLIPGGPLHGAAEHSARWIAAIVPMLFIGFLIPGIAYGIKAGTFRSDHDIATSLAAIIADLAPYIVLAFVAAQFTAAFSYSHLGELIGITGGRALAVLDLPAVILALGFLVMAMAANLFIGSASAKYAFMAPVFVPMLMQANLSPEATQAAYRVGDSITNIITPLNPYWVIVVGFMQRWRPEAGIGTLMALMLPYALGFAVVWPALLAIWLALGIPLGPGV
jgi:aminobenzoyl-glutamate transport protein